jgi:hypothetical protein
MKARALKATRVSDAAALDVILGSPDGERYRRLDIQVQPLVDGSIRIDIEVPAPLAPPVTSLLAALGVKGQR